MSGYGHQHSAQHSPQTMIRSGSLNMPNHHPVRTIHAPPPGGAPCYNIEVAQYQPHKMQFLHILHNGGL